MWGTPRPDLTSLLALLTSGGAQQLTGVRHVFYGLGWLDMDSQLYCVEFHLPFPLKSPVVSAWVLDEIVWPSR